MPPFRLLGFALAAVACAASAAPPRRIVSLDLCADQYLIALADTGQIVSLSRNARDPDMSYYAARAQSLPATATSAEQILLLRPDLVFGAPYRQRAALDPLVARGAKLIDLPPMDDLAGIEAAITLVADAIGHPGRGAALIASIRARLAAIGPPPGRGRIAAYYQRQGYLTGTGTLVDEMMRRIGLANLARTEHLPALARLSVEQIAIARPDFLILESDSARVTDKGTEMLHHPLIDRAIPPTRHLLIPQALTVCGGPSYPDAVERLAAAVRAADAVAR